MQAPSPYTARAEVPEIRWLDSASGRDTLVGVADRADAFVEVSAMPSGGVRVVVLSCGVRASAAGDLRAAVQSCAAEFSPLAADIEPAAPAAQLPLPC